LNPERFLSVIEGPNQIGEYKSVDFSQYDAIATNGLESCVAVATFTPWKATLAHLTNRTMDNDLLPKYFAWLKENVDPETTVYIAGGMEGRSETLVKRLRDLVQGASLKQTQPYDLLGTDRRHVMLDRDGKLKISYYGEFRQGV